jgi:hypothetical protein
MATNQTGERTMTTKTDKEIIERYRISTGLNWGFAEAAKRAIPGQWSMVSSTGLIDSDASLAALYERRGNPLLCYCLVAPCGTPCKQMAAAAYASPFNYPNN